MPRLLLVDDNPSIHRIAESLLASTAIELVCVDSAAEALDRILRGERFDVAMVDTTMPGMDGWALLERLRSLEATARMPIALMAGVLDPVDPQKLECAPIQGFLKKPIELRELADRVKALMETPVGTLPAIHPEPLAAQPLSGEDAQAALASFPEFTPTLQLLEEEEEDDLLVLTIEDLLPEEIPAEAPALATAPDALADLALEKLDLEGLQDLSAETAEPAAPAMAHETGPTHEMSPLPELDTLGGIALPDFLEADLGAPPVLPALEPLPAAPALPATGAFHPGPAVEAFLPPAPPVSAPVSETPELPSAPAPPAPSPDLSQVSPQILVEALMADSQAMSQLTKALVAQLGEEQLKALAWEVLPDLAKKLS